MDLTFNEKENAFRQECRSWLEANVPKEPLQSGDTGEGFAQHVTDIEHAHICAGHAGYFKAGHAASTGIGDIDFDFFFVELTAAQFGAEFLAGGIGCIVADQGIEHPLLGVEFSLGEHFFAQTLADHGDGNFNQIADDLFDVAANIANFGKFGCLNFQKRGIGETCQAA